MLMTVIIIAFVIGVLILLHELGHFFMAKKVGFKVEELKIGWGPAIFKKEYKETIYSLGIFPSGGACYIEELGDNVFNKDEVYDRNKIIDKIKILLAGPLMDFIVICMILFFLGAPFSNLVRGVIVGSPAYNSGIQNGDIIVEVGGESINSYGEFNWLINKYKNEDVELKIQRDDILIPKVVTVEENNYYSYWNLGVIPKREFIGFRNIIEGVPILFQITRETFELILPINKNSINDSFVSNNNTELEIEKENSSDGLVGPIGFINSFKKVFEEDSKYNIVFAFEQLLLGLAVVNFFLIIFNLLPFPTFDGGRIIIYGIELVKGSYINPKLKLSVLVTANIFMFMMFFYYFGKDLIWLFR